MIWAQAQDRVIGDGGTMPWNLPEDMRYFTSTTKGHPVVMGRRTWESFPAKYRPLPERTNIVITRDSSWSAAGAQVVHSLDAGLELARPAPGGEDIFVIGGGHVYREAMPRADVLYVTEIDISVAGDTRAPEIPSDFRLAAAEPEAGWLTSTGGVRYRFLRYAREVLRAAR